MHERFHIPWLVRVHTFPSFALSHPDQEFFVGWQVAGYGVLRQGYTGAGSLVLAKGRASMRQRSTSRVRAGHRITRLVG